MEEISLNNSIPFADFQKVKLRVGKIISVEELPHSEKLLKLQIEIGEEKRQILAGIKKAYTREQLVGKKVIVVFNLEPKKLAGELSEGIILAASNEKEGPILLTPESAIESGAEIR